MQFDQFKSTQQLYNQWHAFTQTKLILDQNPAMPDDAKKSTLNALAESFMTTHQKVMIEPDLETTSLMIAGPGSHHG
jgi:hypothetical protein